MDLNGVIDFIESQDDDAFALTSCEISFEDDLCLGREHLDHFESLIEELETISRASACPWAQVHCFLTSQKIQDMCIINHNISSVADLQVVLQFCEDIVIRPANFAPPSKDANTETVTDHQSEIIMYLTGAVLHKLKKRYARSNRSDDLDIIEGLFSHEKNKGSRPSPIAVESRGGLLTFVEALEPLMRIAYQKFKIGLKSAGLFSAEVMQSGLPEESSISDLDDRVMNKPSTGQKVLYLWPSAPPCHKGGTSQWLKTQAEMNQFKEEKKHVPVTEAEDSSNR
ncbi:hypothetical protein CAPTEDRAFT_206380 [Capitella teleta]|uniref:Uncharacterized protein n=1 Tax=Capitella teleta TaxID=283909 RepID=R7VBM4_CAPTE|nr:hypothetical protein CAPTEDRAFT_206380 [Capitella teleta]|eukprot:ELU13100.1 hypothetical protein CAPTEDRAFT_206380 [Capitella teleta]